MIRVNLLPFRAARKKENIKRQFFVFLFFVILVCAGIYVYNDILNNKIDTLKNGIADTEKQIAKYKKQTKEIARIKKALMLLKQKIAVIENLEKNRREPLRLLDAMTQLVIPKRMWFTKLSSKGSTVNTVGIALDQQTVADFMTRLQGSEIFSGVSLKSIKKQAVKTTGTSLKSFNVSCQKKTPKAAGGSKEKK